VLGALGLILRQRLGHEARLDQPNTHLACDRKHKKDHISSLPNPSKATPTSQVQPKMQQRNAHNDRQSDHEFDGLSDH
jgi:hypothetical protein